MSKTIIADIGAEYDPDHNTLKLDEPLEGVRGRVRVRVEVEGMPSSKPARPWMEFRGMFDEESGRQIAAAIRDAFGSEEIEV
jgi:hypothetical protein